MERHEILEVMAELKLHGMRASFDEIAGKGLARRDELYPLIAGLLQAERTHRQARSISYRIGGAKFPVLKDLDTFVQAQARGICASGWPAPSSAPAPRDGSTIWSTLSTNSNKRKPLAGAADWRKNCYATI